MPGLDSALNLARMGFRVFPVHGIRAGRCTCNILDCGSPGKHPISAGWQGQASSEPERVTAMFSRLPNANVGVATGDGLVVIDLDGADGATTLATWEAEHGALTSTLQVLTGGGGRHLYFRTSAVLSNSVRKLGPGVDVRAEGGFVVGPGSLHISGRTYAWAGEEAADDM